MAFLDVRLFGPGQLFYHDGTELVLRGRKELALLAYLAVEQGRAHSRDAIVGLLWPELTQNDARNNLRVSLARLRRMLNGDEAGLLTTTRRTLQFNQADNVTVDVIAFHQLRAEIDAHSHENLHHCAPCRQRMVQAIALYRAEFLQGFALEECEAFEAWLLNQREHLYVQMAALLPELVQSYLLLGDLKQAEAVIRQRLVVDPLQEDAHRQLMELLVQTGQRHAALVQYETCRRWLDEELGVLPSAETVALYEQIRVGKHDKLIGRPDEPVILSSGHPVNRPSTHLFGIDAARAELIATLQAPDRGWIVSVDGIGGIGKTTLAQEVIDHLSSDARFARTVWVSAKQEEFRTASGTIEPTDLPAMDADLLIDRLLDELSAGTQAASTTDMRAALLTLLKERATLVVIDNLETVADYQALVPTLRTLSNPSKFLITSRASLSAYRDVFSLSLGELAQSDAFDLLRYEATMRGIRALAAASDNILAQITDVVGGHPLALNLIVGQLVFLPLPQVLNRLRQASGQRVDELYTYIYWQAWQTLNDASRQLFLTMPMTNNGTYDQLAAMSLLDADELQSALAQLIGLSLVQVAGDLLEPRYRLHRLTETFLMSEVLKWPHP